MTALPQRSLLDALEPIDPYDCCDRIPGVDAPCLCDPDRRESCGFPFCEFKAHLPESEAA